MTNTPNPLRAPVCFFGIYDPGYAHTRMLREGLEAHEYEVVECQVDPAQFKGVQKFFELARLARRLKTQRFSFVLVCFPGHSVAWLARLLFPRQLIVLDALLSLYDSNVHDRKKYTRLSMRAVRDWLLDWSSCTVATKVLLDTTAHIEYFTKKFDIPAYKFIRVPVGTLPTVFFPQNIQIPPEPFRIHFHGSYIPLQGIPTILAAARLLEKEQVQFSVVGSGQDSIAIQASAQDLVQEGIVTFSEKVPLSELAERMARAHVCLGIFGDTEKTQRVIPNKVYEALAMGKPIITADTPAARELLSEETAILIPATNAEALAAAVRALQGNSAELIRLGNAATELFTERLLPDHIVGDLLRRLDFATINAP